MEHYGKVIAPFVDLVNFDVDINASVMMELEGDRPGLTLTATKPIPAGSQITLDAGRFANTALFSNHGFIYPQNPFVAPALF